jgi:hypothetical protein
MNAIPTALFLALTAILITVATSWAADDPNGCFCFVILI